MPITAGTAEAGTLPPAGLRRVLVTLCVTEITSWGVLYYALPVLTGPITAATGWPSVAVTAGLSAGLLVAAVVGIPVGRWLDRHGPHAVMTAGSVLAVPAIVAVATARSLAWFLAAWLIVGVAMGAVLYPPAAAALTRWYGPDRVRALIALTLVAGLASTVFAPLTAALTAHLGWRGTYLVLAGVLAVITIPAHWLGLQLPWPSRPSGGPEHSDVEPGRVVRSRAFLALAVSLSVAAFAGYAVVVNQVPLLLQRGVPAGTAALALGLGGAGQVVGRLGYATLTRRLSVRTRTAVILTAMAVTVALLGVVTMVAALIAAAVAAGMARGVFTLVQSTAITDRWGSAHYGRLSGLLSAPLTIMAALAPFAGAALADAAGGYATAFLVLGAATLAAALLSLTTTPTTTTPAKELLP